LVVGCKDTFVEQLEQYRRRFVQSARERLVASRRRLERVSGSYGFREPANVVARYRQQLDLQKMRCENSLSSAVRDTQQTLDRVDERMHQQLELAVQRGRSELQRVVEVLVHLMKMRHGMGVQDVRRYEMQLRALNPLAVLQRGYSVTRGPDGRIVVKVSDIEPGVKVVTQVSDGSFESEILQIKDS
jgi:exodeoxyribonuclease VII large subunit